MFKNARVTCEWTIITSNNADPLEVARFIFDVREATTRMDQMRLVTTTLGDEDSPEVWINRYYDVQDETSRLLLAHFDYVKSFGATVIVQAQDLGESLVALFEQGVAIDSLNQLDTGEVMLTIRHEDMSVVDDLVSGMKQDA